MNILFIIPNLCSGGAERLVIDICNELNSRPNYSAQIVIFHNINHFAKDISPTKVTYIPSTVSLSIVRKTTFNIDALQEYIEKFNPDIIHTHLFEAEIISRSCFYPKAKWFSHFHDNMPQLQKFSLATLTNKKLITNYFERRYLLKSYKKNGGNHFITISNNANIYAKKVLGDKYPISMQYNAINYKKFYSTEEKPTKPKLTLVNIGSFQHKKNQQFLIDVITYLNSKNVDSQLFFLGDGEYKEQVRSKAQKLGVENQVIFKGNVPNVEDYLKNADIYVHSAYYEPFGLVLLEAMAAGLPVVSLDGQGNRDIIEDGKNGYMIYDNKDFKEFAEKIILLKENENKRKSIAIAGQNFAKNYDIDMYCNKLIELYKKAF